MGLSQQRARTRRAILDAAATLWSRDTTASLSSIACTAGVGRATVHRYFPDRVTLHAELVTDSWAVLQMAVEDSRQAAVSAIDVLHQIITAMVYASTRVTFLFKTTEGAPSKIDSGIAQRVDELILAEIERSQQEGSLDPAVPAKWMELMIWSTVYTALQAAADGLISRQGVDTLICRTLFGSEIDAP